MAQHIPPDRFKMKRDYATKALKDPDMGDMLAEKGQLAKEIWRNPVRGVKQKSGENARKIRARVLLGGDKKDRLVNDVEAFAEHALNREFGNVVERGGEYRSFAINGRNIGHVGQRYDRARRDRAIVRTRAEHVLGGDNRKRRSIVEALENE